MVEVDRKATGHKKNKNKTAAVRNGLYTRVFGEPAVWELPYLLEYPIERT